MHITSMAPIDQLIAAGKGIPHMYLVLIWSRRGSNAFAIRRPCYSPDLVSMLSVDKGSDITKNIPYMYCMLLRSPRTIITTGRSDVFPIGRPCYTQDLIGMTRVDMCRLRSERIPYSDSVVESCRSDRSTIRGPC